eukprot:scaffold149523_cov17-Prasinocladus_malaysianus.AAC.1
MKPQSDVRVGCAAHDSTCGWVVVAMMRADLGLSAEARDLLPDLLLRGDLLQLVGVHRLLT